MTMLIGTGIPDMIQRCKAAGLAEPEIIVNNGITTTIKRKAAAGEVTGEVGGEVTGEVTKLIRILTGEMRRTDIQKALSLRGEENFRTHCLTPALESEYIEMTIPEKPRSKSQKYRLTAKGKALKAQLEKP